MKKLFGSSENGQVLVLLVLAIFALIGFVALAIDGGNMYSSRRTAQNAADASALAGAAQVAKSVKNVNDLKWNCSQLTSLNSNWAVAKQSAVTRANENSFVIAADQATNTVTVNCVSSPEKYIDVFVEITAPVKTAFMQVLGLSQPVNTVQATVRIHPRVVFGGGASIVATRGTCSNVPGPSDGGVTFNGNGDINISGGGIISNDCCTVNGNSTVVNITGGSWTCDGPIVVNPNPDPTNPSIQPKLNPPPTSGPGINVDTAKLDAKLSAACTTIPDYRLKNKAPNNINVPKNQTVNLTTGRYADISVNQGGTLKLGPGLYCIYGGVSIDGTFTGKDVTLYMPDLGSSKVAFTSTANASVDLAAPPLGCDYDVPGCKPAIGGLLLLYMPKDETNGPTPIFKISGNSTSTFEGSILVANTAAEIEGNSAISPCVPTKNRLQLVAETVILSGTGDVCVNYDPDYALQLPALMNLQK